MFGHDSFLWYNVGDWAKLGLAVPNYGNDIASQNGNIRYLVEILGRNLQAVMFHQDARLRTPPSVNTLARIHKLCTRARSILGGRGIPPGKFNMESRHAVPAAEEFLVFPAPYFHVRNKWLKEYAGYILLSLTEAIQHSENAKAIEISQDFAGLIGQYFQRIYTLMAMELLAVPAEQAQADNFTLTDEQLQAYDPGKVFTSTEMIDTVPELMLIPTEDDLKVLTDGIPISQLPQLDRFPSAGPIGTATSTAAPSGSFPAAPTP